MCPTPTGAAGIKADQLAIASTGCHPASVIRAITTLGAKIRIGMPEAVQEAFQYTAAALLHAYDAGLGITVPDRLFWAGDDEESRDDR